MAVWTVIEKQTDDDEGIFVAGTVDGVIIMSWPVGSTEEGELEILDIRRILNYA